MKFGFAMEHCPFSFGEGKKGWGWERGMSWESISKNVFNV